MHKSRKQRNSATTAEERLQHLRRLRNTCVLLGEGKGFVCFNLGGVPWSKPFLDELIAQAEAETTNAG